MDQRVRALQVQPGDIVRDAYGVIRVCAVEQRGNRVELRADDFTVHEVHVDKWLHVVGHHDVDPKIWPHHVVNE